VLSPKAPPGSAPYCVCRDDTIAVGVDAVTVVNMDDDSMGAALGVARGFFKVDPNEET
jgi:hypothetical protein